MLLSTTQSADLSDIQAFKYPNRLEMLKITQYEIFQII